MPRTTQDITGLLLRDRSALGGLLIGFGVGALSQAIAHEGHDTYLQIEAAFYGAGFGALLGAGAGYCAGAITSAAIAVYKSLNDL